jgi:deoxyribonuclease (pyrimidine dimer)
MVRINLLEPKALADQHLIAEFNEILMAIGYYKKHPKLEDIPEHYTLGKGHIKFFKDKLLYLLKRHMRITKEMQRRGFEPKAEMVGVFPTTHYKDYTPTSEAIEIIKERIIWKLNLKPEYYRYCGEYVDIDILKNKIVEAKI